MEISLWSKTAAVTREIRGKIHEFKFKINFYNVVETMSSAEFSAEATASAYKI